MQGESLEEDAPDYALPTAEWDIPLEPEESRKQLLEKLETVGIPIPKRLSAVRPANFNYGRVTDG
jgi:hypothetical protein